MSERWVPTPYMKRAMRFVVSRPSAALILDPGMRKTSITLGAFEVLRRKGVVRSMLVVAPLRVCHSVWPIEAQKWSEFNHLKVVVLHGSKKDKLLHEPADVYVINPEGLGWLSRQRGWSWPSMLVVDESTRFKHTRTERFKALKSVLPKFKRRVILTGTPAPNGLIDLFGQIYILDFGRALGQYVTHYRGEYFHQVGYGGYTWSLNEGAEKKIYKRIAPLAMRLDEADYLKLPGKIQTTMRVHLPPKARASYDKLKRDFLLQLEEGEVTAYNAGALTAKLRQVSNGFVYVDQVGGRTSAQIHDQKVEALSELLEELQGNPLLVAYEFQHERDALIKKFKAPYIGGGVSAKKGAAIIKKWNRGEIPMLLVHPASAGHGLNLQDGGHHLAWFGFTWDLEAYEQLIRRLWRSGQTKPVHVYHLVAHDTVDELVLTALRGKQRTQRALLDALKKMRR